jgi:hypothetical protein
MLPLQARGKRKTKFCATRKGSIFKGPAMQKRARVKKKCYLFKLEGGGNSFLYAFFIYLFLCESIYHI